MEAFENRPPYVDFEMRAVEDREASIVAGTYIAKDVPFAIITPAGSRDKIEKEASLWFAQIKQQTSEGRFPQAWLDAYNSAFKAWQEGQEIPTEGFPIRNWSVLSPGQVKMLIGLNIRTVEDLAAASDDVLDRIGIGARSLKQKAKDFFSVGDANKASAEVNALRAERDGLKLDNDKLLAEIKNLREQVQALQKVSVNA
jgi:hypothetical protein